VRIVVVLRREEDVAEPERQLERALLLLLVRLLPGRAAEPNAIRPSERDPDPLGPREIDVLILRVLPARLEERAGAERELVGDRVEVAADPNAEDVLVVMANVGVRRDRAAGDAVDGDDAVAVRVAGEPELQVVERAVVRPREIDLRVPL